MTTAHTYYVMAQHTVQAGRCLGTESDVIEHFSQYCDPDTLNVSSDDVVAVTLDLAREWTRIPGNDSNAMFWRRAGRNVLDYAGEESAT